MKTNEKVFSRPTDKTKTNPLNSLGKKEFKSSNTKGGIKIKSQWLFKGISFDENLQNVNLVFITLTNKYTGCSEILKIRFTNKIKSCLKKKKKCTFSYNLNI